MNLEEVVKINFKIDSYSRVITECYANSLSNFHYKNSTKLVIIFNFWIKQYLSLFYYSPEKLNNNLDIFKIFFNKKSIRNRTIKHHFFNIIYLIVGRFLQFGFLPGSINQNSIFKKLLIKILNKQLSIIKYSINSHFKKTFDILIDQKNLIKKTNIDFKKKIPICFFLNQIENFINIECYYGYMNNFFEIDYLKILFFNKKIHFTGYVHGGYYGILKKNNYEVIEKSFCDDYVYWGFGENNIIQNRFKISKLKKCYPITNIYHLETNIFTNSVNNYFIPELANELKNNKNFYEIYLKKINNLNVQNISSKFSPGIQFRNLTEKTKINSLFIISTPGVTFFYEALYKGYPFIFLIDKKYLEITTKNINDFLFYLKSKELLFFLEDHKSFIRKILDIKKNGFKKKYFNEIRDYIKITYAS